MSHEKKTSFRLDKYKNTLMTMDDFCLLAFLRVNTNKQLAGETLSLSEELTNLDREKRMRCLNDLFEKARGQGYKFKAYTLQHEMLWAYYLFLLQHAPKSDALSSLVADYQGLMVLRPRKMQPILLLAFYQKKLCSG